jgi:glycine/D-amino acid oxidase-like deaminating enzyme
MTRRGYVVATRESDIDDLIEQLNSGYGEQGKDLIRFHNGVSSQSYQPALSADWQSAPDGVDVIQDGERIRQAFPWFDDEIASVVHIRRAGDISSQQMGQYMLEQIRARGGRLKKAKLHGVQMENGFRLEVVSAGGTECIRAEQWVNAAGPFVKEVAAMIGVDLPVLNVLQQKIAFEDRAGAIPREMPFSIDLDERTLDWTWEERELLADDDDMAWLVESLPGGIHCRPDGGAGGRWVKLGWAYNQTVTEPAWEPSVGGHFPEIVLRRAAALVPSLQTYNGSLPPKYSHYGGYYPMTDENWPLVGPMGVNGAYVVGALSGFGTMAACAAGQICASWLAGVTQPDYVSRLSMARYADADLMSELRTATNKGIL